MGMSHATNELTGARRANALSEPVRFPNRMRMGSFQRVALAERGRPKKEKPGGLFPPSFKNQCTVG
jgi:hypothetical protein